MPDMSPIGNTIIPPNPNQGLQTLSAIIGLKQQQQALQTGQAQQQTAIAESQQAQQKNKEFQAAQNLAINGAKSGNYTKSDGTLDRQKMADDIIAVAPTYGQGISNSLLAGANEIVSNTQAHQNLSRSQQEQMGATFGALATKSNLTPSDFIDSLNELTEQNKDPQFKRMAFSMATHLPANATPQQLQEIARRWSIAATSSESATGQTNPAVSMVQGPSGLVPTNINPQAPGGIKSVGPIQAQGTPPSVVTLPTGQLGTISTGGGSIRAIPGSAQNSQQQAPGRQLPAIPRPGPNDPVYTQQQYKTQNDASLQHVQAMTSTLSDPQNNPQAVRYRNNEILRLTEVAPTGPGKEIWNHIASQFPGSSGDAYQKIGHYLAQNTIANLNSMGVPNTNAGADVSAAATGNVSQNPNAIKEITKVNDAVNTARDKYIQGLQKVTENQSNMDRVPAYRQAFGQAFDINLFRLEDAQRRGDKQEIADITKKLGSQGLKALGQKKRVIDSLATSGQLP